MAAIGSLAFLNPWILAGLAALPILWWLLRAIPPQPKIEAFAAVRLLLGLDDREKQAARTPWWLLALRLLIVAAVLTGFAGPVLNPSKRLAGGDGSGAEEPGAGGPVLVVMDQGWASAPDWEDRKGAARSVIGEAGEAGRRVLFWPLGTGEAPAPVDAPAARAALEATDPAPWPPDRKALLEAAAGLAPGETVWIHDGLAHGGLAHGRDEAALMDRLSALGPLTMIGPQTPAAALTPPRPDVGSKGGSNGGPKGGGMRAEVLRTGGGEETRIVAAFARTEGNGEPGWERRIGTARARFGPGETAAEAAFDLPAELIARVSRLALVEGASAGGTALADGALNRLPAGLAAVDAEETIATLTSPRHYLREALEPWAILREGGIGELLERPPPVLILADHGALSGEDAARLTEYVEEGGTLIRFAGRRLAAAVGGREAGEAGGAGDPLLPVRLRRGGRVLGGALSWSKPRTLGPFAPDGPFRDLRIPEEVDIRTQVLAEPSPDLHGKVWATLDDGTPLVTAARRGGEGGRAGWIVLFHVSADAEWSSLPLSGLFVEMLGRIFSLAPGSLAANPRSEDLAGTEWRADATLDAWGNWAEGETGAGVGLPGAIRPGGRVPGERLAEGRAAKGLPPGIYLQASADGGAGGGGHVGGRMTLNLFRSGDASGEALAAMPDPPPGTRVETLGGADAQRFGPLLLAAALALAVADIFATLWLGGRLFGGRKVAAAGLAALLVWPPGPAEAQDGAREAARDGAAATVAAETTLGYVTTGDPATDRISQQGLRGLGLALTARTSVEPGPPVGVDPERDELHLFPVLYWPLIAENPPSDAALGRLAEYLAGGGLLLIDMKAGNPGSGRATPTAPIAADMRRIARALNLPPLAPVGGDHVLTRSFYLLDRFPGRLRGGAVWAEAPDRDRGPRDESARDLSIPQFDRVDDNVSPVVVGSADWAGAWAVDEEGWFVFPVGRAGDRQRETALRFGVNLVLYALTGNYKSDLVHAPAVLERLGQ